MIMKTGSDNYKDSSIVGILKRIQDRGIEVIVHEPVLTDSEFLGCRVVQDLAAFKQASDLIVTNRLTDALADVQAKVFTRDLFGQD